MAAFEYTALEAGGRRRKGVLEADSVRQVRQLLRDQGLAPLAVETASQSNATSRGPANRASVSQFRQRLSRLDRVLVTRQLATLIGAGMPVEERPWTRWRSRPKSAMPQRSSWAYEAAFWKGRSLASALADFPTSFQCPVSFHRGRGESSQAISTGCWRTWPTTPNASSRHGRNVEMALLYPVGSARFGHAHCWAR